MARAALLALSALSALTVCTGAQAQFKITQTFTTNAAAGWTITGTNNAGTDDSGILTGGYGAIPSNVNDASGNGWLRLTTNQVNQVGGALYTGGSFPSTQGVVVDYEYVSWGGSGADGLSFFLYDAASTMAGAGNGASLGYCSGAGGYLGVGLDEFGNFSSNGATGRCPNNDGPGNTPDSVVVRGPVANNNPYIGGASVGGGIDVPNVTTRPTANKVRYLLVPNGSGGYRVTVSVGLAGATPVPLLNALNFPYVAPSQLRVGIAASTGAATNIHEVRNLSISMPADVSVTKTVTPSSVLKGQAATYTVVVRNNDVNPTDSGDQSPAINAANAPDIVDALPAQLTGVTWTCTATAGSTCPAASGTGNLAIAGGYTMAPGGALTFTIVGTVLTSATCGSTVSNTATADFSATDGFTDINTANNSASASFTVACRSLTLTKISNGGTGTFTFSGNNGWANQSITTTAIGTGTAGAAQLLTAAATATTITEVLPAGWNLTGVSCTEMGSGGAVTVSDSSFTLNAAAVTNSNDIACTVTNSKAPVLRLGKVFPNGRLIASDQFTLTITGAGGPVTVTTSGSTNTPTEAAVLTPATAGSAYTFTEVGAGGATLTDYTSSYNCTNALSAGQAPSGSGASFGITPVVGDDITCTLSNTAVPRADLVMVKTVSPSTVATGALVTYTLTATNNGPSAANNAVVRDTPEPGLDCTTLSPTATCSASAGAACSGATIPVASLLSSTGVSLPTFPSGGSVVITLQCRVTATGTP